MVKSYKVLFFPVDAVGHVNSAIGIAQALAAGGHRPVFFVTQHWRGKLETKYGFDEIIYTAPDITNTTNNNHGQIKADDHGDDFKVANHRAQQLLNEGQFAQDASTLDKMVDIRTKNARSFHTEIVQLDPILRETIARVKPDVIIVDHVVPVPVVEGSGIPWVWTCSCNPLFLIPDERTPPEGSGFAINGDQNEWKIFRQTVSKASEEVWREFNDYIVSCGVKPLKRYEFFNPSPFLNIYPFPLELDYLDIRPLPPNHRQFDHFMRNDKQISFEIPAPLRDKPGKLVYFSLGSMGAADVDNMKRLVTILSKSKHRFIVSKGPLHNEYSLADNMWGEGSVPQLQVLPLVDLVITHGGNNTITETFYFGKPMIVMPLFVDQYDNAQRVHEKGFGIRLDAYKCSEEELLNAIESLLNNKELNEKLMKISQRIQSDNSLAKLPEMIETIVEKHAKK